MTDADDTSFPANDKLAELEAAERRLDEAIPTLAAIVSAEPEHEAALREELQLAARSYWNLRQHLAAPNCWNLRQLPRDRPDFQPSVAKLKLASRRRSIQKAIDSVHDLPDPYFRLVEAAAGPELLAKFQEVNNAMAAAINFAEHMADFAAPPSTDRCVTLLVRNLASIYRAATGMRPTHTWNDVESGFTSPFDRFARDAAKAIHPELIPTDDREDDPAVDPPNRKLARNRKHGSVAEAIRQTCREHAHGPDDPRYRALFEALEQAAKQRAGGRVARREKGPS